jgi:hypothetical protein
MVISLAAVLVAADFGGLGRFVLRTGTSFEVGFLFISGCSIAPAFVQCNKNFSGAGPALSGMPGDALTI